MTAIGFVAIAAGVAAVAEDLARRRISNWTSGAAMLSGFAIHGAQQGWRGIGAAAAGAALGFAVFAVFYFLNGMGGGDVKLMAAFGSLLGPATILCAAWIAAVAGGVMAAASTVVIAVRRSEVEAARADSIPYAPAIVAGVWLAEIAGR